MTPYEFIKKWYGTGDLSSSNLVLKTLSEEYEVRGLEEDRILLFRKRFVQGSHQNTYMVRKAGYAVCGFTTQKTLTKLTSTISCHWRHS